MSEDAERPKKPEGPGEPFSPPEAGILRCPSCGSSTPPDASECPHCRCALATRRCLKCFVLSPSSAQRCSRCGALLPSDSLEVAGGGSCPDCRLPLQARHFGPVGYLECYRCGGLFLGQKAFGALTEDAESRSLVRLDKPPVLRAAGTPVPEVRYRHCPRCGTLMNRTNYSGGSGIIVDSCQTDGIWFDRGELTAVVAFIEGGGLDKFRKREKERLREEIASLESRKRIGDGTSIPVSGTAEKIRTLETIGELVSFVGSLLRKF